MCCFNQKESTSSLEPGHELRALQVVEKVPHVRSETQECRWRCVEKFLRAEKTKENTHTEEAKWCARNAPKVCAERAWQEG